MSFEKKNKKNQPFVSMSLDVPMFFIPVGGFNPSEKYESTWESSPIFGVNIKSTSNHQLESSPLQLHISTSKACIRPKSTLPMAASRL